MTQNNGAPCYDADFDPYGGEHAYINTCSQNYKFEGKEGDTETGNDDFGARYYTSRFGRWLSADWSNVPVPCGWRIVISHSQGACNIVTCLVLINLPPLSVELDVADS